MSNGIERRQFLKVLGVGGAGAGMYGCGGGRAEEILIPYVEPFEDIVPGMSTWYHTTCRECPAGCGMSIRTREGRAIKAEGNPLSPISHGSLCARGQASLHGLYDPDRIPQALSRDGETWSKVTWDDAEQRVAAALGQNRGRAVFLTGSFTGTMDRLLDDFSAAFGMERVRYEPFALEPLRAANRLLFGRDAVPVHDFSLAEVVVTFGADFLETWLSPIDYAHGFVAGHAYDAGRRGTLISVSPHQSLTDMNADEWLPIRPGTEHLVALALARLIADGGADAGGAAALLQTVDVARFAQTAEVSPERLRQVATRFANGGNSLAVGPGIASSHANATAVAAAVAVLNAVAGNIGTTVHVGRDEAPVSAAPVSPAAGAPPAGSYAAMQQLIARMGAGEVGALLVYGPNPLYSMPEHDAVADALGRVPFIASFASFLDDTSARAHLLLPDHHFLESWGDYVPRTGVMALVQPVMTPVFPTKQTGDVLLSVARRANAQLPTPATTYYDYLRDRWMREVHPAAGATAGFEDWWREALQVGLVTLGGQAAPGAVNVNAAGLEQLDLDVPQFTGEAEGKYLVVYPSYKFYDGRLANRLWLQELPDPVNKFTWSSCVELHPDTADELGIDDGHIVRVETPAGSVELAAWRHPGIRPDTIAIQLGQGHEALGTYARDRGVNGFRLIGAVADASSGGLVFLQTRARITPTGEWRRGAVSTLVNTQHGRNVARAMTLEDARARDVERGLALGVAGAAAAPAAPADPTLGAAPGQVAARQGEAVPAGAREGEAASPDTTWELQGTGGFSPLPVPNRPQDYPPPGTHYGEYSEDRPRWALAIDMERCIGCSACITACYAENNIGIVGPELVARGRILHWMRIERYFEGEGETLETRFLPMLCQHCGNAPCEPVCPVFASYHTPDGLNAQVYNRCIGTRYCSNNCPYKVRVFNFFSYEWPEPLNWQLNPDVAVREKGVMEKCTMCVQRIRSAENQARIEGRGTRDGEIVPACAQTCPGEAIVFGNIKDRDSRVARIAASGRGYRVLEDLNTQSAVTYLMKISAHAGATEEH